MPSRVLRMPSWGGGHAITGCCACHHAFRRRHHGADGVPSRVSTTPSRARTLPSRGGRRAITRSDAAITGCWACHHAFRRRHSGVDGVPSRVSRTPSRGGRHAITRFGHAVTARCARCGAGVPVGHPGLVCAVASERPPTLHELRALLGAPGSARCDSHTSPVVTEGNPGRCTGTPAAAREPRPAAREPRPLHGNPGPLPREPRPAATGTPARRNGNPGPLPHTLCVRPASAPPRSPSRQALPCAAPK